MILNKIIESTIKRLEDTASPKAEDAYRFEKSLRGGDISFICEVKKASPSKGVIAENFPYKEIAGEYEAAGAAAVSVLTEPEYFKGKNEYLTEIRQVLKIPILRKDFIINEYQIYEARVIGADAVLLICAALDLQKLREFIMLADKLGMSCLVEAHDEREIDMALNAGARVIGVNNRDLRTFEVDINNSVRLRKYVPKNILYVSESGINTADDVQMLRECGADAVLIGERLMRSRDIKKEIKSLKHDKN